MDPGVPGRRSCASSPTFVEKGLVYKAKKSVHWCITDRTALAEAEVEYDEDHVEPVDRRALRAARRGRGDAGCAHPRPAGKRRVAPSSGRRRPGRCPRTCAVAFHPDADYGVLSRSRARPTSCSSPRRCARRARRAGEGRARPSAAAEPLAEVKGAALEGAALPPSLDRPRLARRARRLRHPRHRHRRRAHRARPRLGRLPDRRQVRPRDLLPGGRGRAASCPRSSTSPARRSSTPTPRSSIVLLDERARCSRSGQRDATRTRSAGAARTRSSSAPPSSGSSASTAAASASARSTAIDKVALVSGLGPGAHPQHDREPPRLVHLAPAAVGRAHPRLLLQGLQRGAADAGDSRARGGRRVRDGERRRLVRRARPPTCCPPGFALPDVRRRRVRRRRRTSSTSGSTPAPRTRPCWRARPDLRWPADVYLEGSDQHRGWFHSSLLIGVGTRGAGALRAGGHPRLHGGRRRAGRSRRAWATTSTPRR